MSHHALQRLVVRLLYDPELVARVYADPEQALAGLELTVAERRQVVAPDRRAYATDPHRRSRSLTDLLREFPGAASLVASAPGGLGLLDRFFSSPFFHAAIEGRGSLALAFGDYLLALAQPPESDPRLAPFARLEQAIARVRRAKAATSAAPDAAATDPWLVANPHSALVQVPADTLDQYTAVLAALTREGRDPVAAIAGEKLQLPPGRTAAGPEEALLIESGPPAPGEASEIRLAPVTPELAELLRAAAPPGAATSALCAAARRLGAEPGEDRQLIADLLRQGLLVAIPAPDGRHAPC